MVENKSEIRNPKSEIKDSKSEQGNKIVTSKLNVWYDGKQALKDISLNVEMNEIMGVIGPSNSGKTSFLKTLNRLNELYPGSRTEGQVLLDGKDIFKEIDKHLLRKKVGIVFALPLPLPLSIFDNVAYGPRLHGIKDKKKITELVEQSLKSAAIWDEVKDRLKENAFKLSGGQQQRLCIARSLSLEPEVLLLDEPTSALDPISTSSIEELLHDLKKNYTIIIVTHNMQQAARVSDKTAFFYVGELVEFDNTKLMFTNPKDQRTQNYITGRFS